MKTHRSPFQAAPTADSTRTFMPATELPPLEEQIATRAEQYASSNSNAASSEKRSRSSDDIARRAYERWEKSGSRHGEDQSHWYAAEQELRNESGTSGGGTAPDPETRREMA